MSTKIRTPVRRQMYTIFKLVKSELCLPSHHTNRSEEWVLTYMANYSTLEEANLGLMYLTTTDSDPASEWNKRKVYSEMTYDQFISDKNNYYQRKYFLTTPTYKVSDLITELKTSLKKDGIIIV